MTDDLHGLFDPPGPRGRRRIAVATGVSVLLLAMVAALAVRQFAAHGQLAADRWTLFGQWPVLRYLGRGLLATVEATAVSATIAVPLGLLFGVARMSGRRLVRLAAGAYIELFRAVPLLLLLFAFLIALPRLGLVLPIFWQLVLPIAISNIAVIAEIFRAGVAALPRGQTEAAQCLGLKGGQIMRLVLAPQALRVIAPTLVGQLVRLLKESTLGYVVSFLELLYTGRVLGEFTHALVQTYLVVAVIFIALNAVLSHLALRLQRRRPAGSRSARRARADATALSAT